jgi:hypothetical protein
VTKRPAVDGPSQYERTKSISRRAGVPIAQVVEVFTERAAIREYLGEMSRAAAEAAAEHDTCDMLEVSR